jgi:hypothetical protein
MYIYLPNYVYFFLVEFYSIEKFACNYVFLFLTYDCNVEIKNEYTFLSFGGN